MGIRLGYYLIILLLLNGACQAGKGWKEITPYQLDKEQGLLTEQTEADKLLWQMLQRTCPKEHRTVEHTHSSKDALGQRMVLQYNPAEHKLETTTYDPNGFFMRRWNYQYHPSTREVEALGYNSSGRLFQKQWTRYNEQGQAVKRKVYTPYYLPRGQTEAPEVHWDISLKNACLFDRNKHLLPAWESILTLGIRTEESFSLNLSTGPWSANVIQGDEILGELEQWFWSLDLVGYSRLGRNRIYAGPGIYRLVYQQCKTDFQRDFKIEDTDGFQLRIGLECPTSLGLNLGFETGYRWSPAARVLDKPRGILIDRLDFDSWITAFTITKKF